MLLPNLCLIILITFLGREIGESLDKLNESSFKNIEKYRNILIIDSLEILVLSVLFFYINQGWK